MYTTHHASLLYMPVYTPYTTLGTPLSVIASTLVNGAALQGVRQRSPGLKPGNN